jgi:hypothetical protein
MAAPLLNVPYASVQDIADASAGLVDVAKTLEALTSSLDNPVVREQLEIQISRLLDFADRLSSAARTSYA